MWPVVGAMHRRPALWFLPVDTLEDTGYNFSAEPVGDRNHLLDDRSAARAALVVVTDISSERREHARQQ